MHCWWTSWQNHTAIMVWPWCVGIVDSPFQTEGPRRENHSHSRFHSTWLLAPSHSMFHPRDSPPSLCFSLVSPLSRHQDRLYVCLHMKYHFLHLQFLACFWDLLNFITLPDGNFFYKNVQQIKATFYKNLQINSIH